MVIQAVSVCCHAGHEDVAVQPIGAGARGRLHLSGRGAAFPVVHVVEDDVESGPGQNAADLVDIVAVSHQVPDPLAQVVRRLAVQHPDFMAALEQFGHQRSSDEQRAADHQNFPGGGRPVRSIIHCVVASRNTPSRDG